LKSVVLKKVVYCETCTKELRDPRTVYWHLINDHKLHVVEEEVEC